MEGKYDFKKIFAWILIILGIFLFIIPQAFQSYAFANQFSGITYSIVSLIIVAVGISLNFFTDAKSIILNSIYVTAAFIFSFVTFSLILLIYDSTNLISTYNSSDYFYLLKISYDLLSETNSIAAILSSLVIPFALLIFYSLNAKLISHDNQKILEFLSLVGIVALFQWGIPALFQISLFY